MPSLFPALFLGDVPNSSYLNKTGSQIVYNFPKIETYKDPSMITGDLSDSQLGGRRRNNNADGGDDDDMRRGNSMGDNDNTQDD